MITAPIERGFGLGKFHRGLMAIAGAIDHQDGHRIAFDIEHGLALTGRAGVG